MSTDDFCPSIDSRDACCDRVIAHTVSVLIVSVLYHVSSYLCNFQFHCFLYKCTVCLLSYPPSYTLLSATSSTATTWISLATPITGLFNGLAPCTIVFR